jgi:hypothetical protein
MRPYAVIFAVLSVLSGCYTVNQERFSIYAASIVTTGTPIVEATARLRDEGFYCDTRSSAPATTCTRTKQSLLPYSCIERINFFPAEDQITIARVDVEKVVCAGL